MAQSPAAPATATSSERLPLYQARSGCGTLGCSISTTWRGQPAWFQLDVDLRCDAGNGQFICTGSPAGSGPFTYHWSASSGASISWTGGSSATGRCTVGRTFRVEFVALDSPQPFESNLTGSLGRRTFRCPIEFR